MPGFVIGKEDADRVTSVCSQRDMLGTHFYWRLNRMHEKLRITRYEDGWQGDFLL